MSISDLSNLINHYEKNPVSFVNKEFGVDCEIYQKEFLEAFADPRYRTRKCVMLSSAGTGKSASKAWASWWFLLCKGVSEHRAKGVAMSMTLDNMRDGYWKEMAVWLEKSALLKEFFDINQKRAFCKNEPNVWNITARTYDKNTNREEAGKVLSGLHGANLAFFVDEAGAIVPDVGKSIDQAFGETGAEFVRLALSGNPMSKDSLLYTEHNDKKNWSFAISSDPDDPKRSQRVSKEWAASRIKKYGRKDPWVMVFILAQFPDAALNTLFSDTDVDNAMAKDAKPDPSRELKIGIDVARFGQDSNVWFPRRGLYASMYSEVRDARTQELHNKTIAVMNRLGEGVPIVDGTGGFGAGLADSLLEAGYYVHEMNFGAKALNEEKFFNARSEWYYNMHLWVKRGGRLPLCEELKKELTGMLMFFDEKGKFRLESKEQMRKRIKRSPDRSDALALTFSVPDNNVIATADDDWDDRPLSVDDIYSYGMQK